MLKKVLTVIAVILLVVGLGFLLFPTVSNFIGKLSAESAAETFDDNSASAVESVTADDGAEVQSASEAVAHGMPTDKKGAVVYKNNKTVLFKSDLDRLYEDSVAYNKALLKGQGTADTVQYDREALDLTEYGITDSVYGYIDVPAISMRLPIYLGAGYTIMSYGAAHLYGTSLPVGDESGNCALAGHTDYPGRIFFDNIRKLSIGDEVSVTNYWETIKYKVIDFKTIDPYDSRDLLIQDGRQLLTLITCIYVTGDDFDRYLVICERVK